VLLSSFLSCSGLRCNFLLLQLLHFRQSALVAWSSTEVSGQKSLNQFPCERWPDHFSS